MNASLNISDYLQILTIIICLYLIVKNITQHKGSISFRLLNIFYFILCFVQFFSLISGRVEANSGAFLIPFFLLMALSLPPIIYLYINSIILKAQKVNFLNHFLLPVIFALLDLLMLIGFVVFKSNVILNKVFYYGLFGVTIGGLVVVFLISGVYYIYSSLVLVNKHRQLISGLYSYDENINLKWVKVFLIGFVIFIVGSTALTIVDTDTLLNKIGFEVLVLFYVGFIGYQSERQNTVSKKIIAESIHQELKVAETTFENVENEIQEPVENLTEKEGLDKNLLEIMERLESYMAEHKPYLSQNLSIYELADMLDTNYKYLSKIINQGYEQNFVSYINQYRIKRAKEMLLSPEFEIYTIEAIANECGFKSKSAFHIAFKKYNHLTPAEFKNASQKQ